MKKILCFLIFFMLLKSILFGTDQSAGKIILNKAVDKRALQGWYKDQLYNKNIGFKNNMIGAFFKINGEIKEPINADISIETAITKVVSDALSFNNFSVLEKAGNSKAMSIDIEIIDLFCVAEESTQMNPSGSGMPAFQSQNDFDLVFEIKLYLKSSDNKILLERTFKYDDFNENMIFLYPNYIRIHFSNILYDKLLVFFQSGLFLEAYKGNKVNFNEYIYRRKLMITLKDAKGIFKSYYSNIPDSIPKDVNSIYLMGNLISKFSSLNNYKELRDLDISYSAMITSLEKLENLTNLKYLTINRCQNLRSIDNIKVLSGLNYLSLRDNFNIKNYKSIDNLKELKVLILSDNYISKIEKFNNLNNLIKLDLSNNKIGKIENLENLTGLVELDLFANNIRVIENIEYLKNLKKLNIYGNPIRSITEASYVFLNEKKMFDKDLSYLKEEIEKGKIKIIK